MPRLKVSELTSVQSYQLTIKGPLRPRRSGRQLLAFYPAEGVVSYRHGLIWLSERETEILIYLAHQPRPLTDLVEACFGNNWNAENENEGTRIAILKLNRKLEPAGLRIISNGINYTITRSTS
jgi:DNA-binding response OmpR family regulator